MHRPSDVISQNYAQVACRNDVCAFHTCERSALVLLRARLVGCAYSLQCDFVVDIDDVDVYSCLLTPTSLFASYFCICLPRWQETTAGMYLEFPLRLGLDGGKPLAITGEQCRIYARTPNRQSSVADACELQSDQSDKVVDEIEYVHGVLEEDIEIHRCIFCQTCSILNVNLLFCSPVLSHTNTRSLTSFFSTSF
eukprot:6181704-Pleurochrysis_carterae.AAC.1